MDSVATYRWRSGYMGPQVKTLCHSCGTGLEASRKESTFGHAELWATCDEDWHKGVCDEHDSGQCLVDRQGVNMGAE